MKNTLVMKFGGTSLMTVDRIKSAAKIVAAAANNNKIVVVVSAMGHTTDELIKLSTAITAMPDLRELDALMATGEQVAASLMAMALQSLGHKAKSFSGAQAGITTDSCFGDAKITVLSVKELSSEIDAGIIPVVTGFQGITFGQDVTTLGRGGSDTTAIALAAALHAERCDIYSDVDGVYSADPRFVTSAMKQESIAMPIMLELAKSGAQILNARSLEVALEHRVSVRVRSTFAPADAGTLITCSEQKQQPSFAGVAVNCAVNCIEIHLERLELGSDRRVTNFKRLRSKTKRELVQLLSDAGVQSEALCPMRPNPFRILVLVKKSETVRALSLLRSTALSIRDITVRTDLSAVSYVTHQTTVKHQTDAIADATSNRIAVTAYVRQPQRLTLIVPESMAWKTAALLHSNLSNCRVVA